MDFISITILRGMMFLFITGVVVTVLMRLHYSNKERREALKEDGFRQSPVVEIVFFPFTKNLMAYAGGHLYKGQALFTDAGSFMGLHTDTGTEFIPACAFTAEQINEIESQLVKEVM